MSFFTSILKPYFERSRSSDVPSEELTEAHGKDSGKEANAALLQATRRGDLKEVETLLKMKGIDINYQEHPDLLAPLHYAVVTDNVEIIRLLLQRGAYIDIQNKNKCTPLHLADKKEVVELLLEYKTSIDAPNQDQETPLFFAVRDRKIQCVRTLLEHGANVNAVSLNGSTAMHHAAMAGDVEIIKLLHQYGADIKATDHQQQTALHKACCQGHQEATELLVNLGALVKPVPKPQRNAEEIYFEPILDLFQDSFSDENLLAAIAKSESLEDLYRSYPDQQKTILQYLQDSQIHMTELQEYRQRIKINCSILWQRREKNGSREIKGTSVVATTTKKFIIKMNWVQRQLDLLVVIKEKAEQFLGSSFSLSRLDQIVKAPHVRRLHRLPGSLAKELNDARKPSTVDTHDLTTNPWAEFKFDSSTYYSGNKKPEKPEKPEPLKVTSPEVYSKKPENVLHSSVTVEFREAKQQIKRKEFKLAIKTLKKAISTQRDRTSYSDPGLVPLLHQLSFCYSARGKRFEAHREFGHIIDCLKIEEKRKEIQGNRNELACLSLQMAYYYLCRSVFVKDWADESKSSEYHKLAKSFSKETMEPRELAAFYANSAIIDFNNLKMKKAKETMQEALSIFGKLGISNDMVLRYKEVLRKAEYYCKKQKKHSHDIDSEVKIKRDEEFDLLLQEPTEFGFEIFKINFKVKKEKEKRVSQTAYGYAATPAGIQSATYTYDRVTPYTKKKIYNA